MFSILQYHVNELQIMLVLINVITLGTLWCMVKNYQQWRYRFRLTPNCSVLQCIAVYCSVLQCIAVYCSVLQCIAVYCSVLQCIAVYCNALQCIAMYCNVLQCIAVYVLQGSESAADMAGYCAIFV